MKLKYSLQVVWSEEDEAFIATVPELPGCMADGKTPSAAVEAAYEVAIEWMKTAEGMGREIPKPLTSDDHDVLARQFRGKVQEEVKRQVEDAVGRVLKELSHLTPMLAAGKDAADYWKDG